MTMAEIAAEVAQKHSVTLSQMRSDDRTHRVCMARHELVYEIRRRTNKSFPQIGGFLNRDYTTCIASVKAWERHLSGHTPHAKRGEYYSHEDLCFLWGFPTHLPSYVEIPGRKKSSVRRKWLDMKAKGQLKRWAA